MVGRCTFGLRPDKRIYRHHRVSGEIDQGGVIISDLYMYISEDWELFLSFSGGRGFLRIWAHMSEKRGGGTPHSFRQPHPAHKNTHIQSISLLIKKIPNLYTNTHLSML